MSIAPLNLPFDRNSLHVLSQFLIDLLGLVVVVVVVMVMSLLHSLCILLVLSDIGSVFSHSMEYLCSLVRVSFAMHKFFSLMKSHWFIFGCVCLAIRQKSSKAFLKHRLWNVLPMCSSIFNGFWFIFLLLLPLRDHILSKSTSIQSQLRSEEGVAEPSQPAH